MKTILYPEKKIFSESYPTAMTKLGRKSPKDTKYSVMSQY